MKYSFRKSFNYHRRRKETSSDDHIYPRIDTNDCSNLVKPIKSKNFLQRRRRHSSSSDKIKSEVFEPRYESSINPPIRTLDRLTYQLRKSFRTTRSRLESTNSTKHLILDKTNDIPLLSTGLTSPLIIPTRINQSISLPNEINSDQQQTNFNRSLRTRFSFLQKKQQEDPNQKSKFIQRFDSLRRSFHIGNRNSPNKSKRYLLSNE